MPRGPRRAARPAPPPAPPPPTRAASGPVGALPDRAQRRGQRPARLHAHAQEVEQGRQLAAHAPGALGSRARQPQVRRQEAGDRRAENDERARGARGPARASGRPGRRQRARPRPPSPPSASRAPSPAGRARRLDASRGGRRGAPAGRARRPTDASTSSRREATVAGARGARGSGNERARSPAGSARARGKGEQRAHQRTLPSRRDQHRGDELEHQRDAHEPRRQERAPQAAGTAGARQLGQQPPRRPAAARRARREARLRRGGPHLVLEPRLVLERSRALAQQPRRGRPRRGAEAGRRPPACPCAASARARACASSASSVARPPRAPRGARRSSCPAAPGSPAAASPSAAAQRVPAAEGVGDRERRLRRAGVHGPRGSARGARAAGGRRAQGPAALSASPATGPTAIVPAGERRHRTRREQPPALRRAGIAALAPGRTSDVHEPGADARAARARPARAQPAGSSSAAPRRPQRAAAQPRAANAARRARSRRHPPRSRPRDAAPRSRPAATAGRGRPRAATARACPRRPPRAPPRVTDSTTRDPSGRRAWWTTSVERARHLLAHRRVRQPHAGHQRERLDPPQRVGRRVRVHRGERAVVTGVQRLEHVQRLAAPHLPHHDAVRAACAARCARAAGS